MRREGYFCRVPWAVQIAKKLIRKGTTRRRIGLARALSKAGHCSRSQARALITDGRVRVNQRVVLDPGKPVVPGTDLIEVDEEKIGRATRIYFMLNKPRGVVTTASDERGRETIYSLLPNGLPWLAPVGRLDKASEGLLLLTNDSAWGARITAPETHLEKTYHVQIAAVADQNLLNRLMAGIRTEDGDFLRVKRAAIVRAGKKNCWIEIMLDEGRNRHIRRLLAACRIEVLRLVRIAIGPLQLGNLGRGRARELTPREKMLLASEDN
jgi:23S rRNA pseudouridine2605 synthase